MSYQGRGYYVEKDSIKAVFNSVKRIGGRYLIHYGTSSNDIASFTKEDTCYISKEKLDDKIRSMYEQYNTAQENFFIAGIYDTDKDFIYPADNDETDHARAIIQELRQRNDAEKSQPLWKRIFNI